MANAVLPYPDMDFTPLDILTAAEMDQLVANDQYLANFVNGLADGSNLSDGVIQARHIGSLNEDYSEDEQKTTIKWFGSPIYKKTIVLPVMPNNTSRDYPHNIQNYDRTCKIEAMMVNADFTTWAIPYEFVKNINVDADGIQVISGYDLSTYSGIITLYYTKTS